MRQEDEEAEEEGDEENKVLRDEERTAAKGLMH